MFKERIFQLRKSKKMTMEEFAKSINAKKSSVNMWENSGVIPRPNILINISKVYNVSIDWLLGNSNKMELEK